MSIFSYEFFILWAVVLLLYFTVAKRWQWQILLVASVLFYLKTAAEMPWILLFVWIVTYSVGVFIDEHKDRKGKIALFLSITSCIVALFVGRTTSVFVTLGNSYFILKAVGYLIDIDRDKKPESDVFKYLLYLIFWPTILEGPFNRSEDFNKYFESSIDYDYTAFTHGLQRFIWGTFKKIVISERLGVISTSILSDPIGKGGFIVLFGVILFALQLYTDFSGFMDMMLGVGETFGLSLPENFRQPFFSKSIHEFWRRWHITLGQWFRDYVMFPFTSSSFIKKNARRIRKKNKLLGKLLPLLLGTCIVWVLTGIWHGFSANYLLWGLYYASIMCVSQIIDATFYKDRKKIENTVADFFRVFRTLAIVVIADTLVCVNDLQSVRAIWHEFLHNMRGGTFTLIADAVVTRTDIAVLVICLLILFVVSLVNENNKSVRLLLDKAPLVVRWAIYYTLIYAILIFGLYDAQYDVSQFMYMQF